MWQPPKQQIDQAKEEADAQRSLRQRIKEKHQDWKARNRAYNYMTSSTPYLGAASAGWGATKWGGRQLKRAGATAGAVAGAGAGVVLSKATEAGDAFIYIFLSILLYFSDIVFRFNGIVITDLTIFTAELVRTVLINGAVLVLLISYAVIYKPNMREYFSTAVLIWTFSLIFFLGGFYRGLFHLIFIIFLYIFLIRPAAQDRAAANYTTAILLLFDYFGYGLLGYYLSSTAQFSGAATLLTSRLILPVWFYYTLILTHEQKKSWLTSLMIFLVISINVFYFTQAFGAVANKSDVLTEKDIKGGLEFWRTGIDGTKEFLKKVWDSGRKAYTDGLIYATGGYYDSLVEENENEPLGVYIEEIKTPELNYFEDEAISQWYTIKARTLDEEEKIEIALECYADYKTDNEENGSIYPDYFEEEPKNLEVYNQELKDIECGFQEFQLKQGSRKLSLFADFNFQTMSYLKRYLMDLETMRAMNREGIDVLTYYKIIDQDPITRYTKGPIKIGIGETGALTGLTSAHENKLRLGFSLEKEWEGKISKINNLTVYLPLGIEFDDDLCKGEFEFNGTEKLGEKEVNVYKMTEQARKSDKRKDKEKMSFNCKIRVDPEGVGDVLGTTPITIKYLRVTAAYNFRLEISKTISVQREEGFNVRISPQNPKSEENLRCIASHSNEKIENGMYRFFKVGDQEDFKSGQAFSKGDPKVLMSHDVGRLNIKTGKVRFEKDDKVFCNISARIRGEDKIIKARSATITIQDTPPKFIIPINLEPQNNDLRCFGIATDTDEDIITSANYEFIGKDKKDSGNISCKSVTQGFKCEKTISKNSFAPNTTVRCTLRPFTGGINGDLVTSNSVPIQ